MQLYQCDKCGKQITEAEVQIILVKFYRTDEEVNQLLEVAIKRGERVSFADMQEISAVEKSLEVDKDCYNTFKKDYFNL